MGDAGEFVEQLSGPDRQLLEVVMHDPVVWGETVLTNRDASPRRYWPHQVNDLRCTARNIIHLDGRDVGKTIVLSTDALHFVATYPGVCGLVAAPHQGHLDTIIEEIEYQLSTSDVLRESIALNAFGKQKIQRKPYFRVEFSNGSILYFRPAGNYGEAFRSLHVERVWVDEGAWLTEAAWKALRQCLKAGGTMRIYSTPNGIRTNTYYRLTFSKQFTQFRWPSWFNPNWTIEREGELTEFYGGKDSAGWQHEVTGEHGKPSYGAFNQEQFDAACQEIVEYRTVRITGDDLSDCQDNAQVFDLLEATLDLTPQAGVFWIGADLGYTNDPTEVVVFQEASGEKPVASLVLRIHCARVAYPILSMLIALLERYYTPAGIGHRQLRKRRRGSAGTAVAGCVSTLEPLWPFAGCRFRWSHRAADPGWRGSAQAHQGTDDLHHQRHAPAPGDSFPAGRPGTAGAIHHAHLYDDQQRGGLLEGPRPHHRRGALRHADPGGRQPRPGR